MTGNPSQFPFEKHVHGGCANAPVLQESSILELLTLGGEGASELIVELVDLYLEDSVVRMNEARDGFQASNAEQVSKIRGIIESLGHTVATPTEARERLALKGAGNVNF